MSSGPSGEVTEICHELIRFDTSNYGDGSGPGERASAEYVAAKLADVGLEPQLYESEPGRTSLIAHWGEPAEGALLIHAHLDVVPAVGADWRVDPFSGEVADGYVWGRGAVDMKDFDAMLLSVVRDRQRTGRKPKRPVTIVFTADEEAGGLKGAGHLVEHHRDQLAHCTEAVGEVGGFSTTVRGQRLYLIEAAEKGMSWIGLKAHGTAGHGSLVQNDNAVTRLAGAVARIGAHEWPVHLTEPMRVLLATLGEIAGVEATPDNAVALIDELGPAAKMIGASLRNISNPTMLGAGYKVNVVPSEATGAVDGRFLPGSEEEFAGELARLCGDGVVIDAHTQAAWESPYGTALTDAMTTALLAEDGEALIAPFLMPAGTDAKHWRKLGIQTYGFTPLRLPEDLDFTGLFHGVDERVPVDALEFGARVLDRFLDLA